MSEGRRGMSRRARGYVRIERQSNGLHNVTVLRKADGVAPQDVVCVHLQCRQIDLGRHVRLIKVGEKTQSSTLVEVYQNFRTKTVTINATDGSHASPA